TVVTVFTIKLVTSFGQAICVKQEPVTLAELDLGGRVTLVTKHSYRQTCCGYGRNGSIVQQQGRTMTGVANLHFAAGGGFSADQRGIVRPHRTLGKKEIGPLDRLPDTPTPADQTAKDRVQATHQEGRSHTLSRDVADEKIK